MPGDNTARSTVELNRGWTLTAVGGHTPDHLNGTTVGARVPGVVHTDLLAAGLIPDPYLEQHEHQLSWIGRTDWQYRCAFTHPGPDGYERSDLVCEGLDTLATLTLNGTPLGRTANQHRSYRFDITGALVAGDNLLTITFDAATTAADALHLAAPRPFIGHHPFNTLRKMAGNFGWDWGPDLVTAGIWRPIGIEQTRTARIAHVRPLVTRADTAHAQVDFHIDIDRYDHAAATPLTVETRIGDRHQRHPVPEAGGSVRVSVEIDRPDLWWPRGYGEQPLYASEVHLTSDGEVLDSWRGRVGLRSVELDTRDDGEGSPFIIRVNGQDVFVRGANWIPDDAFPSRLTAERYAQRLTDAQEADINLLRVWGGGIYESRDFYDLCDERGILVWQDFLFACAAYAEEELAAEVEAEAREAVTRLAQHPSLILWNGSNENVWGITEWGWQDDVKDISWGRGFYDDLLPRLVAELDPTRPYIPSSPYSPSPGDDPNEPSTGLTHIWDVWNDKDYLHYAAYTPRFVSEFGFQGPPNWATLTTAVGDPHATPTSPALLAHQKAPDGNEKLRRGWHGHFPDPDPENLTDWHWTGQLNQARALTFAVERFRALAPYCRGTIVWQLNDCWPVISWAVVDGYGRRKPAWHALRHAYADRLATVQPASDGTAELALVNDTATPWSARLRVRRLTFDGVLLAHTTIETTAPARTARRHPLGPGLATATDVPREVLVVDDPTHTQGVRDHHHFYAQDVDLALPVPRLSATCTPVGGGFRIDIEAHTLLRDLTLQVDRLDPGARVDDALVTLLPGGQAQFTVTTSASPPTADQLAHPVLTTANHLTTRTH